MNANERGQVARDYTENLNGVEHNAASAMSGWKRSLSGRAVAMEQPEELQPDTKTARSRGEVNSGRLSVAEVPSIIRLHVAARAQAPIEIPVAAKFSGQAESVRHEAKWRLLATQNSRFLAEDA